MNKQIISAKNSENSLYLFKGKIEKGVLIKTNDSDLELIIKVTERARNCGTVHSISRYLGYIGILTSKYIDHYLIPVERKMIYPPLKNYEKYDKMLKGVKK